MPFSIYLIHWLPPSNIYHCQCRRRGEKGLLLFFKWKTFVFSLKIISFLPQLSNNLSFYVLFILNFHFLKLDPLLGLDAGTFQIFLCSLTRLQLYTKPYIWCILKTSQTYAPKLSLPPFRNVIQLKFSMRLKLIKSASIQSHYIYYVFERNLGRQFFEVTLFADIENLYLHLRVNIVEIISLVVKSKQEHNHVARSFYKGIAVI